MSRRRTQKGSIYQRHGHWYVRYFEDRIVDGQLKHERLSKQIGPVTTRGKRPPKSIEQEAASAVAEATIMCATPERVLTFGDYVENAYFPHVKQFKRASTMHGYKAMWGTHLKQLCADRWLKDVRTYDVQAWLDVIGKSGEISRNYMQRIKAFVSAAFKVAKQLGYFVGENPARDTAVSPKATAPKDGYAYSLEEIAAVLAVLPEPSQTVFAVGAFAGLRRGEIVGLHWDDYRAGQITVNRSIWGKHINAPKTRKSAGAVPVIKQLADRLELYRMKSGNPQSGPMFANQKGKPTSIDNLLHRQILPALYKCGQCGKQQKNHIGADHKYRRSESLPEWRGFHAARRGLASNLYSLGVPDIVIQRILRHSDVSITQRCYIKAFDQTTKDAMNKLEQILSGTQMAPNQPKNIPQALPANEHRLQ